MSCGSSDASLNEKSPAFKVKLTVSLFVGSLVLLVLLNAFFAVQGMAFDISTEFFIGYVSTCLLCMGLWGMSGTISQYKKGYAMGAKERNNLYFAFLPDVEIRYEADKDLERFVEAFWWNVFRCGISILVGALGLVVLTFQTLAR